MKFQIICDNCKQIIELDHAALERLIEKKATFIVCKDCQRKKDADFIRKFKG